MTEFADIAEGEITTTGEPSPVTRAELMRSLGFARWCRLEFACAARVLPLYVASYRGDVAKRIIELAADCRDSPRVRDHLPALLGELQSSLMVILDASPSGGALRAAYAGHAVLAAGWTAIGDPMAWQGEPELECDPESWTAAFYASMAEAGGAPWEAGTDVAARRTFWSWYVGAYRRLAQQSE